VEIEHLIQQRSSCEGKKGIEEIRFLLLFRRVPLESVEQSISLATHLGSRRNSSSSPIDSSFLLIASRIMEIVFSKLLLLVDGEVLVVPNEL